VEGGARLKARSVIEGDVEFDEIKLKIKEYFLAVSIILFSKHLFLFFWKQCAKLNKFWMRD